MSKLLICLLIVSACSTSKKSSKPEVASLQAPQIAFEISQGIKHPENILYSHAHQSFFVSNIASGKPMETKMVSYISKISADGKTVKAEWVKGLKAPKGLLILGNDLFVTDVDRLVKIDIKRSRISKVYPVAGSKFLNDLAADKNGNIYISDMLSNILYRLQNNKVSKWIQDDRIQGANGLYMAADAHLLVARWGDKMDPNTFITQIPGDVVAVNLKDPSEMVSSKSVQGHLDGLAFDNNQNLWISDWMNGNVYKMNKAGEGHKIYNFGQGTADISFAKELNLLLIPQMNESKLIFVTPQ